MKKSIYTLSVFVSFTLSVYVTHAQNTNIKSTGKVVTKNISFSVTENDYTVDELEKFNAYVKTHIKKINGANGEVVISFTNEKDGSITNAKIDRGITKATDEEALRLVRSYPKWKPNTKDGKPISETITTSISFGKIRHKISAP